MPSFGKPETRATASDFSIVPKNFIGGFIPVNNESCMRCHEDAGNVVNLVGDTRWRLQGSDAIFSFHPFAPESLDRDIRFNPILLQAGLLENPKENHASPSWGTASFQSVPYPISSLRTRATRPLLSGSY
jgi:hypothetical protein